jgi:hypothetical protein
MVVPYPAAGLFHAGRMRKVLGRPVVIDALFVAGASQLGERK